MFWLQAALLLLPPIAVHRYVSRMQDDADDGFGATVSAIVVFVLQGTFLAIGGFAWLLAALVFIASCAMAYATWTRANPPVRSP